MDSSPSGHKPCILHVLPTLASGGAERQLLTYLSNPALTDRFRHIVVMTDPVSLAPSDPRNHFTGSIQALGIEVLCINRPGSRNVAGCIRELRRIIRERHVDLVHTHLLWANIAGRIAARTCGVPVISTFHSTHYHPAIVGTSVFDRLKTRVIRWLDRFTSRHCLAQSVAVSETVSRHIQEYLGTKPESITVIHNTFAVDQVTPTCDDPRGKVFGILGLPPESRLVLAIGRAIPLKGHVELIKAMAELFGKRDGVYLAIVGTQMDKPYFAEVCETIDKLGVGAKVRLIEPRRDIADFLAAAEVFAFPSKVEGLGIALIEALACGKPSVCSDIEVLREVVRHEETGLVVPVGDTGALADAILRLLDDGNLANKLGERGRIHVYEHFHPDRKAEEVAKLYIDILNR